jgi:FtsP/CotA-like multicopper oxidase with cupredoxin domain
MCGRRNARRAVLVLISLAIAFAWSAGQAIRAAEEGPALSTAPQQPEGSNARRRMPRMTQAQRQAAAARAKAARAKAVAQALKVQAAPTGALQPGATVVAQAAAALVTALDAVAPAPGGTPDYFGPYSNWANSPLPMGPVTAVALTARGEYYCATPTGIITDVYGTGSGATIGSVTVTGGVVTGITLGSPGSNYAGPVVTIVDCPGGAGTGAAATATIAGAANYAGGLRKFIDTLPDLKSIIATPDTTTYPGSDYYEIELVEYTSWQFHTDLGGPTTQRGYRQTNVSPLQAPSYLGPVIVATRGRPTRIKFTNNLPTGAAGNLFIPTDTTIMGAGPGPDGTPYLQNRATLHLHGGLTPWISDGTPHQWIVPAGDVGATHFPTGASAQPVPDMPIPAGGSMTFYWPNQQSGRLMFYHDHALGITRLNVYVGEAAGYLLRDDTEVALENSGVIPPLADNIPLVIQDRTFVWGTPGASGTWATDPTWNWGQNLGSLWFPHVYMPNQNPWDSSGANAMGRWDYALWFWPPYTGILNHGALPNPYAANPGEPPEIPGTPNPSLVPEAFMDTPVVNGKAYPVLTVDPKAYRFQILNAANDRFWNLSLFVAADKNSPTTEGTTGAVLCNPTPADPRVCTEVAMVPAVPSAAYPFPAEWATASDGAGIRPDILDGRTGGVPDPRTVGPNWIQIGTEGGLLPAPVVIPPTPIGYQYNTRNIVVGNVTKHSLFLGPAERADVIVDFSAFAGQTLILYNDSPAPVPATDPRDDYFTGGPDYTDTGGAPPTLPGYGPNTRTVMQINVAATAAAPAFNVAALQAAFASTGTTLGAFAASQDPILVAQDAYDSAYNGNFPSNVAVGTTPGAYARIQDTSMTFNTIAGGTLSTFPFQPKAIQELFEVDYGRMNATLGVELPFTNSNNQTTIPYGYTDPPTELINASATPIAPVAGDGTQLWKITHNGVDTHATHVHLFNVQVINRVGWDGAIRPPEPNELGWKETVRMNPLEDIIVALRPVPPALPFGVPDSVRPLAPSLPIGAPLSTFDPLTGQPITVTNDLFNFGWEYVWHCHLLGHEENDMMRPMAISVPTALPIKPVLTVTGTPGGAINLSWTDGTPAATSLGNPANEVGFRVERAVGTGPFVALASALANATSYVDNASVANTASLYRVVAYNAAGESASNFVSVGGLPFAAVAARPARSLDADRKADIAVYRPAYGTWFWLDSTTGNTTYSYHGWGVQAQGDVPVMGDFDGDGLVDPTVYRPASGTWFILTSSSGYTDWTWFGWGIATDTLVAGDYDGDGRTDAAVFRSSTNTWYIRPSSGVAAWNVVFGQAGDVPVPGDYDGDGKTDVAVWRPASGTWFILTSSSNFAQFVAYGWGNQAAGDEPVPGDYDGDAKTDLAVYRRPSGTWFVLKSSTNYTTFTSWGWGNSTDQPVPADYDGDGMTDAAVYRPSTGQWFIRPANGSTPWNVVFGATNDVPLQKVR